MHDCNNMYQAAFRPMTSTHLFSPPPPRKKREKKTNSEKLSTYGRLYIHPWPPPPPPSDIYMQSIIQAQGIAHVKVHLKYIVNIML